MEQQQINKYRAIFISDIHLGSRGCQAEYLVDFLKNNDCDQLYLVGDIVDIWALKRKIYWPQSHTNVIRRILTKSKRGTDVTWIVGNHDEFLRDFLEWDLRFGNIEILDSCEHVTADGKNLWIVHGDYFDIVTRYAKWLAFLGDIAYNWLIRLNTWWNKIRQTFGFGYWSLSAYLKNKTKQAVNFIGEFENALAHECKKRGNDGVVCGHIHKAEIKLIDDVIYCNDSDWVESCCALVEHYNGDLEIIQWGDGSNPKSLYKLDAATNKITRNNNND